MNSNFERLRSSFISPLGWPRREHPIRGMLDRRMSQDIQRVIWRETHDVVMNRLFLDEEQIKHYVRDQMQEERELRLQQYIEASARRQRR